MSKKNELSQLYLQNIVKIPYETFKNFLQLCLKYNAIVILDTYKFSKEDKLFIKRFNNLYINEHDCGKNNNHGDKNKLYQLYKEFNVIPKVKNNNYEKKNIIKDKKNNFISYSEKDIEANIKEIEDEITNFSKNFKINKLFKTIPIIIILFKILYKNKKKDNTYSIDNKYIHNLNNLFYTSKRQNRNISNLIKNILEDPYEYVKLENTILSYRVAERIEYYFGIEINLYKKMMVFVEYTLYNETFYNITDNALELFELNKKNKKINIQSHIYSLKQLINLLSYEFYQQISDKKIVLSNFFKENIKNIITFDYVWDDEFIKNYVKPLDNIKYLKQFIKYGQYYYSNENFKCNKDIYNDKFITSQINDIEARISKYFIYKSHEKHNKLNNINFVTDLTVEEQESNKGLLKYYKKRPKHSLNPQQQCIYKKEENLVLLYGGPGTGKTHTVAHYIVDYINGFKSIYCLAPTACASQNLFKAITSKHELSKNEKYKIKPYTIDKFINLNFTDKKNPKYLGLTNSCIVIDEISMCSYIHMNNLIKILKKFMNIKLIIMGDYNQLPSISIGSIARDLYENEELKNNIIELNCSERTRDAIGLTENTENIKNRKKIIENINTEIINYDSKEEINKILHDKYNSLLDYNKELDIITPNKFKTICPTNSLVKECNKIIQEMNSNKSLVSEYKTNDVLISILNNYNIDGNLKYSNGDEWILLNCDEDKDSIKLKKNSDEKKIITVTYKNLMEDFTLGYAITTHKSQGLSIEYVFIVIDNNCKSFITNKNYNGKSNLYTGFSRAKTKCIIIKPKTFDLSYVYNSDFNKETNLFNSNSLEDSDGVLIY